MDSLACEVPVLICDLKSQRLSTDEFWQRIAERESGRARSASQRLRSGFEVRSCLLVPEFVVLTRHTVHSNFCWLLLRSVQAVDFASLGRNRQ